MMKAKPLLRLGYTLAQRDKSFVKHASGISKNLLFINGLAMYLG